MRRGILQLCLAGAITVLALAAVVTGASAAQPEPWGTGFQLPATILAEQVAWFEGYTLVIIIAITVFVLLLLLIVIFRFSRARNPNASRTSHNTTVEVIWTVVPVLILVMIAFPSFRLLYQHETIPTPDLTVKATGAQWYWGYEYMDGDLEGVSFISYMLSDEERLARMEEFGLTEREVPRNLAVDFPLVVPAGATVHVLTTSSDVNHAWGVPAFGIKKDSIQGRLNETWFRVNEPGTYFGQCYELCGRSHAFMPIEVVALEPQRFEEWSALAADDMNGANALLLRWQAEARGETPVAALAAE